MIMPVRATLRHIIQHDVRYEPSLNWEGFRGIKASGWMQIMYPQSFSYVFGWMESTQDQGDDCPSLNRVRKEEGYEEAIIALLDRWSGDILISRVILQQVESEGKRWTEVTPAWES